MRGFSTHSLGVEDLDNRPLAIADADFAARVVSLRRLKVSKLRFGASGASEVSNWKCLRASVDFTAARKWSGSTALGVVDRRAERYRPTDREHALLCARIIFGMTSVRITAEVRRNYACRVFTARPVKFRDPVIRDCHAHLRGQEFSGVEPTSGSISTTSEPRQALAEVWSTPIGAIGDRRHSVARQYRFLTVRISKRSPEIAGVAMTIPLMSLVATFLNSRPSLITVTSPRSQTK